MSVDCDHTDDMLKGGLIVGRTVLGILICLMIILCFHDCYTIHKGAKLLKRTAQAQRLTRDLETQTQAHEQTSQPPPRPYAGDFSGFDFSSSPYHQTTVPEPSHRPAQEPNGRPTMQRRQTVDDGIGTPELRRKPSFTNIAKGERSTRQLLAHPEEFELDDIDLRSS
ncbi:hypothetical protein F4813DRAFT_304548 [Daldinia decipiens]|uniref:uncharacterized protein n=1 Tax=Daldinia decipiens TaxID=326647 RepID=UPI0020C4E30A|nr:uncharacterized protein F4813DRAFT_304548 [Daldinia decipiens]KAI1652617.1 hypothetical protein F4813DRAFT_304548 [Daldinia decipiens]